MIGALNQSPGLTTTEFDRFWKDGYLRVPGLAEPDRVEAMKAALRRDLRDNPEPLEREAEVGYPGAPSSLEAVGGSTPRRVLRAYDRDAVFRDWVHEPRVVDRIRRLLNTDTLLFTQAHHNCVMTKQPDYSSDTGWHQDVRYWSFSDRALINCWLALTEECADNGALRVIPGSHRWALPRDRFDEAQFLREDLAENRELIDQAVQLQLDPGDGLLFHAALFHSASRNRTDKPKYSAIFTYHGPATRPLPDTRSSSLPEIPV